MTSRSSANAASSNARRPLWPVMCGHLGVLKCSKERLVEAQPALVEATSPRLSTCPSM